MSPIYPAIRALGMMSPESALLLSRRRHPIASGALVPLYPTPEELAAQRPGTDGPSPSTDGPAARPARPSCGRGAYPPDVVNVFLHGPTRE